MDWNIFGIVHDRDEFEVIDMSNNKIQEISGKAFHKVSSVRRLVLNHNDLLISGQQHHHKRLFLFDVMGVLAGSECATPETSDYLIFCDSIQMMCHSDPHFFLIRLPLEFILVLGLLTR